MSVGTLASYGISGVNATYLTPTMKLYRPPKATRIDAPKAYEVTLTAEAKAKALGVQGYPVSMISLKLGLDIKIIEQYLGISVTASDTTVKMTYTPPESTYRPPELTESAAQPLPTYTSPKSTYVAPKPSYTEPQAMTQARAQLATELTQLPTVQYRASRLISAAKSETPAHTLLQALTQAGGATTGLLPPPSTVSTETWLTMSAM